MLFSDPDVIPWQTRKMFTSVTESMFTLFGVMNGQEWAQLDPMLRDCLMRAEPKSVKNSTGRAPTNQIFSSGISRMIPWESASQSLMSAPASLSRVVGRRDSSRTDYSARKVGM